MNKKSWFIAILCASALSGCNSESVSEQPGSPDKPTKPPTFVPPVDDNIAPLPPFMDKSNDQIGGDGDADLERGGHIWDKAVSELSLPPKETAKLCLSAAAECRYDDENNNFIVTLSTSYVTNTDNPSGPISFGTAMRFEFNEKVRGEGELKPMLGFYSQRKFKDMDSVNFEQVQFSVRSCVDPNFNCDGLRTLKSPTRYQNEEERILGAHGREFTDGYYIAMENLEYYQYQVPFMTGYFRAPGDTHPTGRLVAFGKKDREMFKALYHVAASVHGYH